ncbi:pectinesterase inhibitor 3-like [Andrographis paniculata]|uniref:pectinesterase inhibitor 3-like n=1 Tax=Andrographis paniculata TaxID=175694 RepID=UPI0021E87CE7|nr:pectinesterase inhibitor 3-like [Andrographis paniculata]
MKSALRSGLLLLFLWPLLTPSGAASAPKHDLVRRSCVHASYPSVCLRTLASYGGAASNPHQLALAAVRVSVAHARSASEFLSQLKINGRREKGALADCVDQMGESVDELSRTLAALKHLNSGADFRWQMSNAETWVSAALTNEDTCLDGFKEISGGVRKDVRRRITGVARVTSNALYLINLLDETRG